jgi:hypothetical protein
LSERFGVRHVTLHFETPAMSEGHPHRFVHEHDPEDQNRHGHNACHGHG